MQHDLNEIIRCALADTPALQAYYDARTATASPASQRKKGTNAYTLAKELGDGRDYVVKGLLQRKSYAVLYSDPGQGKSFLTLDLAYHIAAGKPWRDHRVMQGPVIYCAFEGTGGMAKRVAALQQHYGSLEGVPLVIEPASWNLRDRQDRVAFAQRIAEIMHHEFNEAHPALIAIDTFARAIPSADENSAGDVGEFNKAVEELMQRTGACVLVLHHRNKSGGMRGSTALLGAVETQLEIDEGKLIARKQRDVEMGAPIGFELRPVQVGIDADGDPLVSCVVMASASGPQVARKLTGQPLDAWTALCELGGASNSPVLEQDWRAAFDARVWRVESPKADTRSKAFRRAVKELGDRVVKTPDGWRRPLTGGDHG
jgi:hypothetical protein